MVEQFKDEQEGVEGEESFVEFTELPQREVDLDELELAKSMTESEEETEHKTDLQTAMKHLLPKYKTKRMNELLQPIMMSGIFPDNYLDLNYFLVMSMIEEGEGEADIDFSGIVTAAQVATSIGYERRGRIDILEVAGVAHEEEMQKLSKELGI